MMTFARMPRMAVLRRTSRAHLRLAVMSIALVALVGCASVNTTLDRVNQGLTALTDTTGRPASRSGARTVSGAAVRATVPLSLTQPTATRSDTLTAGPEGTHRYTLHEIDTRAWPEGGVLSVEVAVAQGWEGGGSIASFDLYPEGVTPTRTGLPQGVVASTWNVAPGQRALMSYRFERGQRLLLGAEGSWSSPVGTRNLYTFQVRVTASEIPLWRAEGAADDGGTAQTITAWQGARTYTILGGDMAVTVPRTRAQAWAGELARWLTRAERREATACAARLNETISGPALVDASGAATESTVPAVVVTCALRRGAGARPLPSYELSVATADGYSHAVSVRATQLRELAALLQGNDARSGAP